MKLQFFTKFNARKYAFYKIPKVLFENEWLNSLTTDAKLLYGLLLDRTELSIKNNWIDENGRAYIIYTRDEIAEDMCCGKSKVTTMLGELEKHGLVKRFPQGFGKPPLLYLLDFIEDNIVSNVSADIEKCENQTTISVNFTPREVRKSDTNNTDTSNTYVSDTDLSFSYPKAPNSENEEEADNGMHSKGTAKAQIDSAECDKVVQLYNSTCVSLPKVKAMTEKRKKVITARLKDHDMSELSKVFEMAENSDFLKHGAGTWPGANFDWLMNENNLVKVLEGNYRNGNNNSKNKGSILDNESMNDWEKQMSIREELYGANSELAQLFGTGDIANDYQ